MTDARHSESGGSLKAALTHTASLLREKVAELSLVRELAECAAHIENREHLGTAIAHAIQGALQVDACALFVRDGGSWSCLGGCGVAPDGPDPRHAAEGLLDLAASAVGGTAFSGNGSTPQLALELRQNRQVIGALVLTDDDVAEVHRRVPELLSIVAAQAATLLSAALLFARIADSNRYLEAELERRSRLLKNAQESLHQKEKLASLGQLLTGVSHEVNNRLVPILGYAQLLKGLELPEMGAKAAASIETAALGCRQVVEDLLAFGWPEKPRQAPAELPGLLREITRAFRQGESPASLQLLVEGEPPPVRVDAHQVGQVFQNVIRNAVEAVEGKADGHVRVTVSVAQNRVVVRVEDNGRGMPEEVRRRVFEPFFTTKTVGEGTGLGLSLAYGLVQANGGEIEAESRQGIGSRFTVSFPACAPAEAEGPDGEATDPHEASHEFLNHNKLISQNILVIEEETQVREFLVHALGADHQVTTAPDTASARQALQGNTFDVVLLDLRLDEGGGIRLFEWVRSATPDMADRVVFMTGDSRDPEAGRFLASQPNPHLVKPFTIDELSATVRRAAHRAAAGSGATGAADKQPAGDSTNTPGVSVPTD
jgi:signal transduction histidine kinase/ActR/RegA family two-component response regulator